jgi:1,4-alpha-glucan branching enzyme/maltooligosyltrehalose trehalohydrolase
VGLPQPFLFFCDFDGELGEAVRKGRREEFSRFAGFKDRIPIPSPRRRSSAACCAGRIAMRAGSRTTRNCFLA